MLTIIILISIFSLFRHYLRSWMFHGVCLLIIINYIYYGQIAFAITTAITYLVVPNLMDEFRIGVHFNRG